MLALLPVHIREAIRHENRNSELLEVVMDLGRLPSARYTDGEIALGAVEVTREEIDHVELYGAPDHADADSKNFVLCPGKAYDRSPCGTGTAAKLALLHHYRKIALNEPYINASPLGTTFEAQLVEKTMIGDFEASITRITGNAWITGVHHFTLDQTDPFQQGYLV